MTPTATPTDKGLVEINELECKGCGLCAAACARMVLSLAPYLNHYGYHPATYQGHGCNGCGLCFYACPEPGAIRVSKTIA
jgi:NAD-dependent dihydropyrimidine dehydrogenase PreA subunit